MSGDNEDSQFGELSLSDASLTEPSLSEFGEGSTFGETSVVMTDNPAKDKGIEVPPLPKFNIYIGMQLIGLIALCLACFLMYLELQTYSFDREPNAAAIMPAGKVPPAAAAPSAARPAAAAPAPATPAMPASADPDAALPPATPGN